MFMEVRQNVKRRRARDTRIVMATIPCWALVVLVALTHSCVSGQMYEKKTFLVDAVNVAVTNLGAFPHECFGNVNLCPNGFSVSFLYTPEAGDINLPYQYILSSGGQTALSHGFYVRRNYGYEFEVGVAMSDKVWSLTFLLQNGYQTPIVFTWKKEIGLTVYSDGQLVASATTDDTRIDMASSIDLFPTIVVGKANNDVTGDVTSVKLKIRNILIMDISVTAEMLLNNFQGIAYGLPTETIGCKTVLPSGVISDAGASDSVLICRQYCAKKKRQVAYFGSGTCSCSFFKNVAESVRSASSTSGSGDCKFTMVWATHASEVTGREFNIHVEILKTDNNYIRPDETATITLSHTSVEDVEYKIDFGDNNVRVTTANVVAHDWKAAGEYRIGVEGRTRTTSVTVYKNVTIVWVEEGLPPEAVSAKVDAVLSVKNVGVVEAFVESFSLHETRCDLYFGEPESDVAYSNVGIIEESKRYQYKEIGLYNLTWSCRNAYGTNQEQLIALAANPDYQYESMPRRGTISVPVVGADMAAELRVNIDAENFTPKIQKQPNAVKIDSSLFKTSGEHVVRMSSGPTTLLTKVFNLQVQPDQITINAPIIHARVNRTLHISFSVAQGDFLHVAIDYGNGNSEMLFIPSAETGIVFNRTIIYANLGYYYITIYIANDVGYKEVVQIVSIERPIYNVNMTASHSVDLGIPTLFTFDVDMNMSPAMPVTLKFDYNDGTVETVTLGSKTPVAHTLTHQHTYDNYGMYDVVVHIQNNISSHEIQATVQVGQDLTQVDMTVKADHLVVNQEAELSVDVPKGNPIILEVDMGDGHTVVVTQGLKGGDGVYLKETTHGMTTTSSLDITTAAIEVLIPVDGNTTLTNGTMVTRGQRRKRSAGGPVGALESDGKFHIKYIYTAAGEFKVTTNVYNIFTTVRSFLCPSVTVLPVRHPKPTCPKLKVLMKSPSSYNTPLVYHRSKEIVMETSTVLDCTGSASGSHIPIYTWSSERQMSDKTWRPELEVCSSAQTNSTLVINGNSLWYGKYTVGVYMGVEMLVPAKRKKRAASGTTQNTLLKSDRVNSYIQIVPTPLVAEISGLSKKDFYQGSILSIDLSNSVDPDVSPNNKSGMNFDLFCYSEGVADQMSKKTLDELIAMSSRVKNNTRDTTVLYDTHNCFLGDYHAMSLGEHVAIMASHLSNNESLIFDLIITKDTRMARISQTIKIWATNFSANSFDTLNDLLASGDLNAALFVMDYIVGNLESVAGNSNNSKAEEEMRTKIIGALDSVSKGIENVGQLGKTAEVMSKVTAASDKVTPEAKATAAGALSNTADKAKQLGKDATADEINSVGGNMVDGVGNVLPFGVEQPDNEYEAEVVQDAIPSSYYNPDDVVTTVGPNGEMTTINPLPPGPKLPKFRKKKKRHRTPADMCVSDVEDPNDKRTCCQKQFGLCKWLEPKPMGHPPLDDLEWKYRIWDDKTCEEIHPDDLLFIWERFDKFREQEQLRKNALMKKTTESGMAACSGIGGVIQGKQGKGSTGVNLASPKMNITIAKMDQKNGGGKIEGVTMAGDQKAAGAMVMNSPNPFGYAAKGVTSDVLTMELYNADGSVKAVDNSAKPFEMWISGDGTEPYPFQTLYQYKQLTTGKANFNYHTTNIARNQSGLRIIITPDDLSTEITYEVFIKHNGYPNDTYYDFKGTIPNKMVIPPLSALPDGYTEDLRYKMRYSFSPPSNVTEFSGNYTIGVRLRGAYQMIGAESQARNYTYFYQVYTTACRFFNKSSDSWDSGGCEIGELTTYVKTQCKCTHLTSFASDLVVPPNTIDFNTVFSAEKFIEAIPVFVTVALVLLIYIAVVIWARREDKNDVIKWGALPLEDNLPTDQYHYQFTACTGVKKTAGTKSKVSFILSGDDADTGVRRMYDGKRKELLAASINNYILSTEQCLGPLTYLRIWHDNMGKGKSRSWFLGQVQITDLQTGDRFFFLCDRWLAVEEDDGMVERIMPVAGLSDMVSFKNLFSSSVRKKLTNDHLWFSVVSRPTRSSFTRVQRVSCCMSLLFLTMITNCMFFQKDENPENVTAISIGPITFTLNQLFISVVTTAIVFPPNLFIVTVFRKARAKKNTIEQMNQQRSKKFRWRTLNPGSSLWNNVEKSKGQKFKDTMRNILSFHQQSKYEADEPKNKRRKKKKGFSLPYWTLYIGWFVCILSILASGFFTILYSMEWGRAKSIEWLTTFLLSFFESVVVVQPVKVLMLAAFVSCIMRKPDIEEEEDFEDDTNPTAANEELMSNSQRDLQELIKQRRMQTSELAPPNLESLAESRELRMKELTMEAILKECIIYFFFILVLFFLSYEARDSDSFNLSNNIKNTFVHNTPAFGSISKPNDFWKWAHSTLLPNMYSGPWYNGKTINWREGLQMDDRQTIRVGVARLRQQRVKDDSCKVQKVFKPLIHHCRDQYSWSDDDTKNYLPGWQSVPEENTTMVEEDKLSSWVYRDSIDLANAPYAGRLTMYKGGGYTLNFQRNRYHTKILLEKLESMEWIDVRTRALFIEFTLYNANANLFGSVVMLVEYLATGAAVQKSEVKVFRISGYIGGYGVVVIIFEVSYLAFTLFFLVKMCRDLRKQKMKYFNDFWNLLEFATLILSIVAVAMYAMKKVFAEVAMRALHKCGGRAPSGEYVNFVSIAVWDEVFALILAMVVFLATIKFIKMLKFNRRMGMMGDTIRYAMKDLKYFTITFMLYFAAFCHAAYLLFGKNLPNYGSIIGSVEALFAFALGSFDFYEFQDADKLLGPIFFFLYVGIVYIGLMGMFLTIIYDAFAAVKANAENRSNDYEIVDFMWKKFKGVFGWGG